jgi:hypothetical protein
MTPFRMYSGVLNEGSPQAKEAAPLIVALNMAMPLMAEILTSWTLCATRCGEKGCSGFFLVTLTPVDKNQALFCGVRMAVVQRHAYTIQLW